MRILLTIFVLASVCLASDWHQDCPIQNDWRAQNNWINEPVAWSNTTTISTNENCKSNDVWSNEVVFAQICSAYGGSITNGFEKNQVIWSSVKSTLTPDQQDQMRDNMILLVGLYAKLLNFGTDWSGVRCSTTITTNTVSTPTRYRWQDYGLPGPVPR